MLTPQFLLPIAQEIVVDLFAGGGRELCRNGRGQAGRMNPWLYWEAVFVSIAAMWLAIAARSSRQAEADWAELVR